MCAKLAIIPARGGSKRIPRKNIKEFNGKPIIAYSINAALESGLFDRVIVSTDDDEIAKIATYYGAEIPFIRPKNISDDFASTNDVIIHTLKWFIDKETDFDLACCIYATAPFLQPNDLLLASAMLDKDSDFIFSATEYTYPIARSFKLTENNRVQMYFPENFGKRSQDLSKAYHDAGMFYLGRPHAFLENKPFFDFYSKAYLLPHYRVQDIDTMDDWVRAENYHKLLVKEKL